MPYIQQEQRENYDQQIDQLVYSLLNEYPGDNGKTCSPGELNYVISSVIWKIFNKSKSYTHANELMGVLECVKQEFYRRQIVPYEDQKCTENGDII